MLLDRGVPSVANQSASNNPIKRLHLRIGFISLASLSVKEINPSFKSSVAEEEEEEQEEEEQEEEEEGKMKQIQ